jgi:hypothetical protein
MNPKQNPNEAGLDTRLEKALEEIRNEAIDPAVEAAAKQRVWARLDTVAGEAAPELIHGCADFRALIPDYVARQLSTPRALLLKDHTHECVACRKALETATGSARPKVMTIPEKRGWPAAPVMKFAVAAAVLVAVGISAYQIYDRLLPSTSTTAEVQATRGQVFNVSGDGATLISAGAKLAGGAEIRTAKDAWASVRLPDGSVVEVRDRTGFSISVTRRDLTVNLSRGGIIVQAAKRYRGHLYVATHDAKVAVTGTIFAVDSGIQGTRVSVLEGEVHVDHNGRKDILHVGDQTVTAQSLSPVPVADAVSWSQNAGKYLALLKESNALGKEFSAIQLPELRYSSRLIKYAPAGTVIYAAVPNLAPALAEAVDIFRRRSEESPELREWWDTKAGSRQHPNLDQMITSIRAAGDYVGNEVAIVAVKGAGQRTQAPAVLVELRRDGFRQFLETELPKLGDGRPAPLLFVTSAAEIPAEASRKVVVLLKPGVAVMSPDAETIRQIDAVMDGQAPSFAASPFAAYIGGLYQQGVGMLLCADLNTITAGKLATASEAGRQVFGDVRYLVAEYKQIANATQTRAAVTFAGQRTGISSWLASPGPIGGLDFISPDASFASAFAVKSPVDIVRDLIAWHEKSNPNFRQGLSDVEASLGINIEQDLAAQLGSEFVIALDGPLLPKPSWKAVAVVPNPAALQTTIARLVERANEKLALLGKPRINLTTETVGSRVWYRIALGGSEGLAEVNYAFVDGYLLAGANRPLIERALVNRDAGNTLPRSERFTSILPRDSHTDFSAMVYHNAGDTLGSFFESLSGNQALTPEQQEAARQVREGMRATVVTIYGDPNQISVATNSNLIDLSVRNILGISGPAGLARSFGLATQGRKSEPAKGSTRMRF